MEATKDKITIKKNGVNMILDTIKRKIGAQCSHQRLSYIPQNFHHLMRQTVICQKKSNFNMSMTKSKSGARS